MSRAQRTQAAIDSFYEKHGPCCAGCDWWRWHNSVVGDCFRSAPVSGIDLVSMIGATGSSLATPAGHVMTLREHVCGEFRDDGAAKH